jgi:hypothetical protein
MFYYFRGDCRGQLLVSFLLAVSHFQLHPLTLQSPIVSLTAAVTKDGNIVFKQREDSLIVTMSSRSI